MTRSKSKGAGQGGAAGKGVDNFGVSFVEISLTAGDKEAIRAMDMGEVDLFLNIEELVDNGYKVSLSIDLNNTGGICAVTGKRGCTPETNEGRCLMSRGPDVRWAILSMIYKLQVYCVDGHFPLGKVSGEVDLE
jgi:hypothetical protein